MKYDMSRLCKICGKWRNAKEDHTRCSRIKQKMGGQQKARPVKTPSEDYLRYLSKL